MKGDYVLNGIAWDSDNKRYINLFRYKLVNSLLIFPFSSLYIRLFVTGKKWPIIWEIKIKDLDLADIGDTQAKDIGDL